MELVTLQTFYTSFEAHLLKLKLENEGILCFVFDDAMNGLYPLFSSPIGGVKLKINSEDIEKAEELIKSWNNENT